MARSATLDPIEKFRFKVTVISLDISAVAAVDALGIINKKFSIISRAGFSEVTLPKATINEISYRENIDNQRFSKIPGLTKYEPVILKRGATDNRDLYKWYKLVHDDMALLGVAQELTKDSTAPVQSENFRKEVIITSLDREGNPIKQWMLFNAFPVSYKGGNDLSANIEEKLIEELTLTYEWFLELEGGIDGFSKELAEEEDALEGAVLTGINLALAQGKLPFTR